METFLIKTVQLLLSLSILVIVHEFGHFIFARLFKVRVEKFYLFFDPWFSLFKFRHGAARDTRSGSIGGSTLPSPMPGAGSTANVVYMDGHVDSISLQQMLGTYPTSKECGSWSWGETIRVLKAGIIDTKGNAM